MVGIGQTLREAREQKQITTSKAAADTNIRIQHIEAMERDDFSRMAAPIYAKGFIRIYAEYLGLDPAPLIAEYMAKHAPRERPPLVVPEFQARDEKSAEDGSGESRRWNIDWRAWAGMAREWLIGNAPRIIGVAVVVALVWGGGQWIRRARARAAERAAAEAAAAAAEMQRVELPLPAEPPEPYIELSEDPTS